MKKYFFFILTVLFLIISGYGQKPKAVPPVPITLDQRIQTTLEGFQGKGWIYAKNLDTGKDYCLRCDEQTRTASTIRAIFCRW